MSEVFRSCLSSKVTFQKVSVWHALQVLMISGCLAVPSSVSALEKEEAVSSADNTEIQAIETMDADRYQMRREGEVIVRLDKKTGIMSTCEMKGTGLVCRAAADERAALEEEIANLQARLDAGEGAGSIQTDEPQEEAKKPETKSDQAFDEELDKVVEMSSKVLRRFFTVMKELKEDFAQ